jgi:hypothetical protein
MLADASPAVVVFAMLNLPSQPGTTGLVMLVCGTFAGLLVLVLWRDRVAEELNAAPTDRGVPWLVTALFSLTIAVAPFTLWRVAVDIRETSPITAEHARFVGAETKLIDGELVEEIAGLLPQDATYSVAVAPGAYLEIRESLAHWLGYALIPRRQVRDARAGGWIVVWGATPADLGIRAHKTRLIGRNRLSDEEPVYIAEPRS